jgi:hypothetical protein
MLGRSRFRGVLGGVSLALCVSGALILLEDCGGGSEAANAWPEQCDLVLKPLETMELTDNQGGFSTPHDVRMSSYVAQRCVRIASVWWAQGAGTGDDVAVRAVATCQRQITDELRQHAAWEAEPLTSNPKLQADLSKERQQIGAQLQASHSTPLDIHRETARDSAKRAREGKCWRFLDRHDVASLVAPQRF